MLKEILLPVGIVAAIIILVGVFVQNSGKINLGQINHATPTPVALEEKIITVGTKITKVTLAKTESQREKGLGGIKSMDLDHGMLFVFDQKGVRPGFWMKDILIPLDLIWIANNKVVKIDRDVKAPALGTPDSQLGVYTSSVPIDYVLEVNAGFCNNNGVNVGDSVDLSKI